MRTVNEQGEDSAGSLARGEFDRFGAGGPGITVTDDEVKQFYDQNVDKRNPNALYYTPESVQVAIIAVNTPQARPITLDKIVREQNGGGCEWCLVRPTTVWGPGMSAHYQLFLRMVQGGYYVHVGHDQLWKSYSYIDNIAFQYWRLRKDLEILLVDATQCLAAARLFPHGRLREPLSAARRVTCRARAVPAPGR